MVAIEAVAESISSQTIVSSVMGVPNISSHAKQRDRETVLVCAQACISMCASEHVHSLFMARNQLSLAHNGNVNSPERFSPTQGESWLGECCVFPNPNSGK